MRNLLPVFLLLNVAFAGSPSEQRPKFSDYAVREIYSGTPAVPKLSQDQRTFRTMIRRGSNKKVEFAGHYTVPLWGCGTSCNQFAVVDSVTGTVYDVPFSIVEFPGAWFDSHDADTYKRMEFYPSSRLMKINACPNERDCGFYDYVIVAGKGLELVRKELLPKQYQPE
jgi:hypothetical protein